jgi:hypothetical protein
MTPAEHDKRQAESDAGMEQWEEELPERLLARATNWHYGTREPMTEQEAHDLTSAACEIRELRARLAEVAVLRLRVDALEANQLADIAVSPWQRRKEETP